MAGELCYVKNGSALAYSKIASNNGALIFKGGGWYIEIELVPKTASDAWTGIWGIYISSKSETVDVTGYYRVSGYYWNCYDDKATCNVRNDSAQLFTRVNQLKWRTGVIDANAGDTIDSLDFSVTTFLANKFVTSSLSNNLHSYGAYYTAGYNYVNGFGHDIYITSYSAGGKEIQRERCGYTRTNMPYSYCWAFTNGSSVTIDMMKLTITKDGDDAGKFKLAYANP